MAERTDGPLIGRLADRWTLLGLAALALLVRLVFIAAEPETYPVGDETMWLTWGTEVLPSPEVAFSPFAPGFRFIFHPPLYPYFLGGIFAAFGSLTAIKCFQALVSALLVPAVAGLGTTIGGRRVGLVAAGITTFYPELVWFSAHFWAETLFLTILWWAFARLARADEKGSIGSALGAGLLFGLAALVRETVLYFTPLCALWLGWRRSRGFARGALFLAAAVVAIAPWTYRNWRVFDTFVPVSTAGALNLWQGNTRLSRQDVYEQNWAIRGRIAQYENARRKGLEAIVERQPWWIFEKLRDEMPNFWEADSQALVHLRRGAYAEVRPRTALLATALVVGPYLLVLVAAVAALGTMPFGRLSGLLLGFLVYYSLIHVATHGYARYRLPVLPVLFVLAGWRLASARAAPAERPAWGRRALVVAVASALVASIVPSVRLMFRPHGLVSEGARYAPGAESEGGLPGTVEEGER